MSAVFEPPVPRAWAVGALCQAITQALATRFNPVRVEGEISGWSRAASGHCYFSLKDADGQLRCAMFRRAADTLEFAPRDGQRVQVHGRLAVYEPRGDLQLVVERLSLAGAGTLFEEFLRLKQRLEAQGLFDATRKRPIAPHPRILGVVTSLGAAAWQDVQTALQRRVPHVRVVLAPALVQGVAAPAELVAALGQLAAWRCAPASDAATDMPDAAPVGVDGILLVRGGGSLEDLWAFNDEALVHAVANCPVPVITGIGHETDFTLCDFAADLRAPTPTAAAELAATPRDELARALNRVQSDLATALEHGLQRRAQNLDALAFRLGRPTAALAQHRTHLARLGERLPAATRALLQQTQHGLAQTELQWRHAAAAPLRAEQARVQQLAARLDALNPRGVLRRGYAWLTQPNGVPLTSVAQAQSGQVAHAVLHDGTLDVQVTAVHPQP